MIQPATLQFLKRLKKNNNKPWFDSHRAAYEAARDDFGGFIQHVLDAYSVKDTDLRSLKAKDCVFRINRDIRFSKDKTPYKSNLGASLIRGGKKSIFSGYYFHCSPGDSFVGGGLWMPTPQDLKKVRQEIDYCWDEFRKIVHAKAFVTQYEDLTREDYALSTMPKGYDRDNPAAEYLKLKCFVAMRPLSDAELTSPGLVKSVVKAFDALHPLLAFMNRAIEHEG